MVYFKKGKFSVKTFEDLCPDLKVYLMYGHYELNVLTRTLTYLDDPKSDIQDNIKTTSFRFYNKLGIKDFNSDQKIRLYLDRRGIFSRTDDERKRARIEDLFMPSSNVARRN